jgi:hypothetical protein
MSQHSGRSWVLGLWIATSVFVVSGCGKKGPPLPPFVRVPAPVTQLTARRIADDVVVNLALPVQNVDQSTPVSLGRVEIYAYTGRTAPPAPRFPQVATLVGTIEIKPEAPATTTLRDPLTPDDLVEGPSSPSATNGSTRNTTAAPSQAAGPLRRFYMAIAFSERGRAGPPSTVVEVPLSGLPDAPPEVRATYNADAVTLTWDPSGGLLGFLLDSTSLPPASPLDDGPPATGSGGLPPGPTRYNVYREIQSASETSEANEKTPPASASTLVTVTPVDGFSFTDPLQSDGRRRCYTVSAVRGRTDGAVEGHSSKAACVSAVDVFPPKAPTGLSPIAVEGAISLVWEANSEDDLQGYLVLRGEEESETLTRITDEVVKETRYTDKTVQPGVRYVYVVVAVDRQAPEANISAQSERVEVTAR